MNTNMKRTMLALAVTTLFGTSMAQAAVHNNIHNNVHNNINNTVDNTVDSTYKSKINNKANNTVNNTVDNSISNSSDSSYKSKVNNSVDNSISNSSDTSYKSKVNNKFDNTVSNAVDTSYKSKVNNKVNNSVDTSYKSKVNNSFKNTVDNSHTDAITNVDTDVNVDKNVNVDVRKEKNAHSVDFAQKEHTGFTTDVNVTGNPTVSGDMAIDSAAAASIDNRQSVSGNLGLNDKLSNTSNIVDNTAQNASGNIGMNTAAGDNNTQDNATALAATDASFAFGLSNAGVAVNQDGNGNATWNNGVTNQAGISGNAFQNATGNIGVNVTSGNNNEQKNALAASVSTSRFSQASVSSNQMSSGNMTSNAGKVERFADTTRVNMHGSVSGYSIGVGVGAYEGSSTGRYRGDTSSDSTGMAYQANNFYPDNWNGDTHTGGDQVGHSDFDNETQGAMANPNRDGVGGLAFDTESSSTGSESGQTQSRDSGKLGFVELSASDLYANLSGTVQTWRYVVMNATNDAKLSGNAFQNASGNIGVNVASGTGNLQANSLSMAVSQAGSGAPPPTGGGEQ